MVQANNLNLTEALKNLPRTIKLYNKINKLEDFICDNVISYCERCGTKIQKSDVMQVGHEGNIRLFVIKCHKCGYQQSLVLSLLDGAVAKATDIVLDVPLNKVRKYAQKGPITAKDVIKMHDILKRVKTLKDFLDSPL